MSLHTQFIDASELSVLKGRPETLYILKEAPFTGYLWNGSAMAPVSQFTQEEASGIQALVSPDGIANGTLLAEVTPNTLLTDSDTLFRQLGFVTIPGGKMSARSRLEITHLSDLTGNDSKTIQLRAGAASGSFATATPFGGVSGATTQKYVGASSLLWNDNSLNAQRTAPVGAVFWGSLNTGNPSLALAIDTSLDWNIYVAFQSALAGGAPTNSATLRNFFVRMIG